MYNETNTSRSEMVSIAIVEDDAVQAKCIEKYINSWVCEKFAEVRVCIFTSAENFLFEFEDNKDLNIILLDVMMHGMNGIGMKTSTFRLPIPAPENGTCTAENSLRQKREKITVSD